MALPAANNAEGGTNGTTVSTANSGGTSGTAWDAVNIAGTSTFTFDNAQAAHGALAYKLVTQSGTSNFLTWSTALGTPTRLYGRIYLYLPANPTVTCFFVQLLSGGTTCALLQINTAGTLSILDTAFTVRATSATSLNLNAWTRIEFDFTFSTTVGAANVSIFTSPDSVTATETFSTSGRNFGAASANVYRLGIIGAPANVVTFWLDSLQVNATALPGPDVSLVTVPGATAGIALAAPAGAIGVGVNGATAAVNLAAPAGAIGVGVNGATAATNLTAPAGTVSTGAASVSVPGATSALVLAAIAGTVSTSVLGTTAAVALVAPPGLVSTAVAGTTATVAFVAPSGAVAVSVPGVTAAVNLVAPAGTAGVPAAPAAALYLTAQSATTAALSPSVSTGAVLTAAVQRGGPS